MGPSIEAKFPTQQAPSVRRRKAATLRLFFKAYLEDEAGKRVKDERRLAASHGGKDETAWDGIDFLDQGVARDLARSNPALALPVISATPHASEWSAERRAVETPDCP